MRSIDVVTAIREALAEEMARDERVIVLGNGVQVSSDGSTAGLVERFGERRVLETPVSEAAVCGMAAGAAVGGLRPVVRVGNLGFSLTAMDQITNEAAKIHYKFNGQLSVPVVYCFETAFAGWGVHHAQAIHAVFCHLPGLKVAMPGTVSDAKGLLKAAIRDDNPVAFIVHRDQYSQVGVVSESDDTVELGKARVVREGREVTIVTCGWFVPRALQAAEMLEAGGVSAEIVDLRSIVPLDWETITASVRKTGRAVVYDQGHLSCGVAATVAAGIQQRVFKALKAPVLTLASEDAPIPYNPVLENRVVPTVDRLCEVVRACLAL